MKFVVLAFAVLCAGLIGCSPSGPSGLGPERVARRPLALPFNTPTPPPGHLYVDHDGMFFVYDLPLAAGSKPRLTLPETTPGALPPQIAADQFGSVALASPTEIELFRPPIRSFAGKFARLRIPLTPAITQLSASGADLSDLEFDPNENLWLLNNFGGGQVSELQAPLTKYAIAATSIAFGVTGTKTSSYGSVRQARFDVNGNLYVYATQTQGSFSLLFKSGFPYAKPPSGLFGLDLSSPDDVDPTQWVNGPPPDISGGLLLGQYNGPLASPAPGKSPPPAVSVLAQFTLPILGVGAVLPSATVSDVTSGIVADPDRNVFYSLSQSNGALKVYPLPLYTNAKPLVTLVCAARQSTLCNNKPEHLFVAP